MAPANATYPVSPPKAGTGWTIPGKAFVGPFLVLLVVTLAVTLSISLQFQAIMQRLDLARSVWPAASTELSRRYADIDSVMGRDGNGWSEESTQQWRQAYAAFRETSQYDRQLPHAAQLEDLIAAQSSATATPLPDAPAIDALRAAEVRRLDAQTSWIGRCTIFALRLKLPNTFIRKA